MAEHLGGPGTWSIVLSPDLAEITRARQFVGGVATGAGFGEARVYDITLLASEAAANAIEHAPVKGLVEIKALLHSDRLEVQVKGPGEFQTPDRLKEQRARGLGLPLMAKLSDHLALYSAPEGGTLLALTFYREGHRAPRSGSPLPPSLLELFETSDRLEAVFGTMPEGFAILDEELCCVYLNEAAAEHYGRPASELLGVRLPSLNREAPQILSLFAAAKAGNREATRELHRPLSDLWAEVSVIPFPGGFAVFSRDVTDRRRKDEALRQRSLLPDLSSEAIFAWELDGPIRYWNSEAQGLYGYSVEEAVGAVGDDLLETVFPLPISELKHVLRTKGQWVGELNHRHKDGHAVVVDSRMERVEAAGVTLVLESDRCLTERAARLGSRAGRRQQKSVSSGDRLLAEAQRVGRFGSWEWDLESGEVKWSRELYAIYGIDPHAFSPTMEALGRYLHPDDQRPVRDAVARILANAGPVAFAFRIVREDGTVRALSTRAEVTGVDARGKPRVLVGVSMDVTEQKEAEEALRESAERYRILAEENERLYRQQLDIAEKLQVALLNIPSEIGRVRVGHLYRSATEAARVGGDFYDVFEVKGGLVCLLVGDVAGHGIEAARTATLVKDVIHAFAHQSVRPQEVLRRTNALLVEKELPGFVTLFLGILDGETGEFRYASAGHPSTFLRRASGEVLVLGTGSAPLGVHPEANWKAGSAVLEAGDLLLLYTDGVIEARRGGEYFGEKRLETLLMRKRISVERLPHIVLDQVLAFSGGSLCDDVAVLALSLTGSPAGSTKPASTPKQVSLLG